MAKAKKGHVAIPFLLAFLLGIVGIGGIAMYLFNQLNGPDGPKPMTLNIDKPTEEDNMTLMFVLDEPNDACSLTFMAVRILPEQKKMILVSLPSNMLAIVDNRQDTLANFYQTGGIQSAMNAIQSEAGIYADRYIILNSESFQKICNIFAGVNYQIPLGTQGFVDNSEEQYLGPSQIEKLVTNPFFGDGESERSAMASDVISEMINQTDYDRIVASMDSSFRTLINMMNTDISSMDYSNVKSALKYMYTYGSRICTFRLATGSTSEDGMFVLDRDFPEKMSDIFGGQNTSIPASTVQPAAVPETSAITEENAGDAAVPEENPDGEAVPEDNADDAVIPEDNGDDGTPEDNADDADAPDENAEE